ncbi:hypothetical protein CpMRi49_01470 [Corynebacterium ulcerans]|uniref:hypothetical protein n=1 Tax=Corynebacterium ulcerans TaxID=65058 RepID=UPI00130337EB|nr:hypothetical protein [Corynebacterium ulcerans]QGZ24698.1 hypothetical protein CpMRi49_01470 [Corynebacterium ulcerans]
MSTQGSSNVFVENHKLADSLNLRTLEILDQMIFQMKENLVPVARYSVHDSQYVSVHYSAMPVALSSDVIDRRRW